MDIIGAAALIAVGIVVAAVLYARVHPAAAAASGHARGRAGRDGDVSKHAAELSERAAALATREESLARRESELERQRAELQDGRQELARTLERVSGLSAARAKALLLQDGRIHPARIEETYYQAKSELEQRIVELGEEGVFEAGVQGLHAELVKLLGRLRFRTSYGQNVLAHSIEVSRLAAMMADELGASAKTARRAALLHDIGKAVSHEIEGPHALVGGDLARKYGEPEAVAHAMEAHHNEVEPQTIEAVIVQAADALSGARPGARGESLEQYVKRLRDLEQLATRHAGVDKVYAMQAGREIRVMVAPGQIDDDAATLLSHEIAREIEKELEYPGQIKVTVIRESRATEYAR